MNNRLVLLLLLFPAARLVAQNPVRLDEVVRAQADSGFSGVVLVARDTSVLLEKAYSPRTGKRLSLASKVQHRLNDQGVHRGGDPETALAASSFLQRSHLPFFPPRPGDKARTMTTSCWRR